MNRKPLHMLSLCSGIGGIDLAWQWVGGVTVAFAEIDPFCSLVLNKHWPDVPNVGDIRYVTRKSLVSNGIDPNGIDIIAGGIPCQPFSLAGKRRGTEDDRYLWPSALTLIEDIQPTWVVIENVAHFVGMALDIVQTDLEARGYESRAFVFPACAIGAPHIRERCFIVAYAGCGVRRNRGDNWSRGYLSAHSQWSPQEVQPQGNKWQRRASTAREVVADPTSQQDRGLCQSRLQSNVDANGQDVVNASSPGRQECNTTTIPGSEGLAAWERATLRTERQLEPRMGRNADGLSCGMDEHRWPAFSGQTQYDYEPPRTTTERLPNRAKCLKALGNAVVPQHIYPIFEAIMAAVEQEEVPEADGPSPRGNYGSSRTRGGARSRWPLTTS